MMHNNFYQGDQQDPQAGESGPLQSEQYQQSVPPAKRRRRIQNPFWFVVRVVILLGVTVVLLGLLYFGYRSFFSSDAVAVVNGEQIIGTQFEEAVVNQKNVLALQAEDLGANDEQFEKFIAENKNTIRQQVLTAMISRMLVLQAAEKTGVSVSAEQVEAEFQSQVKALPKETTLGEVLEKTGKTEKEIKNEIKDQLTINAFLQENKRLDTTVSQEDVGKLYNALATRFVARNGTSSDKTLPTFSEVDTALKARLLKRRQLLAAQDILNVLQAASKVVVYADGLAYPAIQGDLFKKKSAQ